MELLSQKLGKVVQRKTPAARIQPKLDGGERVQLVWLEPSELRELKFDDYQRHDDWMTGQSNAATRAIVNRYARDLESGKVSPEQLDPILVNVRANGEPYCPDGGHRARAAIEAGVAIKAEVTFGLNKEEEQEKFRIINGGRRSISNNKLLEIDQSDFGRWLHDYVNSDKPLAHTLDYRDGHRFPINGFARANIVHTSRKVSYFTIPINDAIEAGNRQLHEYGVDDFTEAAVALWGFMEDAWGDNVQHKLSYQFLTQSVRAVTRFAIALQLQGGSLSDNYIREKMASFNWYDAVNRSQLLGDAEGGVDVVRERFLVHHLNKNRRPQYQIKTLAEL